MTLEIVAKRQKWIDIVNAVVAFVSIMIVYYEVGCIQSEEFYNDITEGEGKDKKVIKDSNESNLKVNLMRGGNICLTIIIRKLNTVVLIYLHYKYELLKQKYRQQIPMSSKLYKGTLRDSGMVKYMVLEMTIFGIFCPPYFDFEFSGEMLNGTYTYSYDSIIAVITI